MAPRGSTPYYWSTSGKDSDLCRENIVSPPMRMTAQAPETISFPAKTPAKTDSWDVNLEKEEEIFSIDMSMDQNVITPQSQVSNSSASIPLPHLNSGSGYATPHLKLQYDEQKLHCEPLMNEDNKIDSRILRHHSSAKISRKSSGLPVDSRHFHSQPTEHQGGGYYLEGGRLDEEQQHEVRKYEEHKDINEGIVEEWNDASWNPTRSLSKEIHSDDSKVKNNVANQENRSCDQEDKCHDTTAEPCGEYGNNEGGYATPHVRLQYDKYSPTFPNSCTSPALSRVSSGNMSGDNQYQQQHFHQQEHQQQQKQQQHLDCVKQVEEIADGNIYKYTVEKGRSPTNELRGARGSPGDNTSMLQKRRIQDSIDNMKSGSRQERMMERLKHTPTDLFVIEENDEYVHPSLSNSSSSKNEKLKKNDNVTNTMTTRVKKHQNDGTCTKDSRGVVGMKVVHNEMDYQIPSQQGVTPTKATEVPQTVDHQVLSQQIVPSTNAIVASKREENHELSQLVVPQIKVMEVANKSTEIAETLVVANSISSHKKDSSNTDAQDTVVKIKTMDELSLEEETVRPITQAPVRRNRKNLSTTHAIKVERLGSKKRDEHGQRKVQIHSTLKKHKIRGKQVPEKDEQLLDEHATISPSNASVVVRGLNAGTLTPQHHVVKRPQANQKSEQSTISCISFVIP